MKAEMSLIKWKEKLRKWQSLARPLFTIINSEQMDLKIIIFKARQCHQNAGSDHRAARHS